MVSNKYDYISNKIDFCYTLPPSQIIRHSKNPGESKYFKFDKNYRTNYKDLRD